MPLTPLYTYFTQIAFSYSAARLGASWLLLLLLALNQYLACPALAQGDWGYEEKTTGSPDKAAPAPPALPSINPSATEKAKIPTRSLVPAKSLVPTKDVAPAKPVVLKKPQVEASGPIVTLDDSRCWLELFALCASSSNEDDRKEVLELATLSLDQKNRLGKLLESKLKAPNNNWVGVAAVWKPLRPRILQEMDVKESYRLLFEQDPRIFGRHRTLTRLTWRSANSRTRSAGTDRRCRKCLLRHDLFSLSKTQARPLCRW